MRLVACKQCRVAFQVPGDLRYCSEPCRGLGAPRRKKAARIWNGAGVVYSVGMFLGGAMFLQPVTETIWSVLIPGGRWHGHAGPVPPIVEWVSLCLWFAAILAGCVAIVAGSVATTIMDITQFISRSD